MSKFTYLGRVLEHTNNDSEAATKRIAIANTTFRTLYRTTLRQQSVSRMTQLRVFDAIVQAQVLFGAESWTASQHVREKLDKFQQRAYRNVLHMNPTWHHEQQRINYPPKFEVLAAADRPLLSHMVDHAAVRFYGHLLRRPDGDDARFLLSAQIAGLSGRACGPQLQTVDQYRRLATEAGLQTSHAATRSRWRRANVERLAQRRRETSRAPTEQQQQQQQRLTAQRLTTGNGRGVGAPAPDGNG